MTAAITAAGVAVVGSAIIQNQANKAAEGAANAQKKSISAATDVERERLALESQQYQEQMQEYKRKQAMNEKQMQQTIVNLAPYMQAGQGALYEMMALTGMAAPTGATMPETTQPTIAGIRAGGTPAPQTTTGAGRMGILSKSPIVSLTGTMTQPQGVASDAAAELQKGGLSLGSKRWQMVSPDASPRAKAAHTFQAVQQEMPGATAQQVMDEAANRLNLEAGAVTEQALMDEARGQVPTVEAAVSPYAGMTGEQAQEAAVQKIAQSPLLQELMQQGETGILQSAAATGGLRGGRTQAALAQFRPQMLQQEIDKLYSRLSGISAVGQQSITGAPTTATGQAPVMSYQSDIPGLMTQAGAAQAGGLLGQAQAQKDMFGNIGTAVGWGLEKYSQGGFSPWSPQATQAPQYSGLGIGNPANY